MACIRPFRAEKVRGFSKETIYSCSLLSFLLCLSVVNTGCGAAASQASSPSTPSPAAALKISAPPSHATVGVPYNAVSSVSGGSSPYLFGVSGTMPPGLSLNPSTGSITGTPTVAGTYDFELNVSTISATADTSTPIQVGLGAVHPSKLYGSNSGHIVVSSTALTISPNSASVPSQGQQQFTAHLSGTADTAVTWSATRGTISSNGTFVAPKVSGDTPVTITAKSANSKSEAAATVTVTGQTPLAITSASLPEGNTGSPYSATLAATGGVSPYQWNLASGSLPSGIQLQSGSGVITGTTTVAGVYPITAKVTDTGGQSASLAFTLTISSNSTNGFDGPAELPRVYIQTSTSNTPASGTTISVNTGGNLQSALNSANCGDTIQLQAGATFTGVFTFPAKSCDDNHWIVVRSSADDSLLPAEGTRLTPCYAGVSALPGRPDFHCTSTATVVAKLVMAGGGSGPIVFAAGANHYRLLGLEITRISGTGRVNALSSVAAGGTASNLIFDRVWMHGTAQDDTTRGVELGGSTYVSIVDSFFTDFHCVSKTGSCTDSQTIYGGLGSEQMGPYKITNNFLEAAGENILFGGGAATVSPADIQISQNHFFKPMTWLPGQAGYVGGADGNAFIVKNHFELKNAQRVLLDGNIMEDSWGGYSQVGFSVVLTPKNPGGTVICSMCQVTDVTIRYNLISHVGAGFEIANGLSDLGALAFAGQRYSIHDVIIDDIDGVKYIGPGEFAQVSVGVGAPLLQSLTINHVTAFPPSHQFIVGDQVATTSQMKNFVFTNNMVNAGVYPVWSSGSGGTANCAYYDSPLTTFNACFSSYVFSSNAIIAASSRYPATAWPAHNFFPVSAAAVEFVNYNGGNGGDYHLQSSSPYKGLGTDGKDLGADVDAVYSAIAGVE